MRFFYLLLLLCSMTVATGLQAQQSFQTRIAEDLDDVDEALAGSSNPEGAMDTGSSDLELGNESADGSRPQIIGLRFQNVSIPKGSVITNARIVFTVDNTDKNADPCTVDINMQAIDDAPQFTETDFDVTSRTTLDIPVNWTVPEGTWITIGEAGPDQTTPDLSALVQQIVDRAGWAAGNSMVFTIQGSGLREAESYSSPDQAPLLMIDYIPAQAVTARIASGDADAEENLGDNSMDVSSSDIELGAERTNGDDLQVTGLHFSGLNIPKGALISPMLPFSFTMTMKKRTAILLLLTFRCSWTATLPYSPVLPVISAAARLL